MMFSHFSDQELESRIIEALDKAHNAPKNLFLNHDGSASVGNSYAWAQFSREWAQLKNEKDRRAQKDLSP